MEPLIYHYTSIETLACILKSGKMRFNRLDNVNDPQESKAYQNSIIAKGFYVSCWSKNAEESIPLWKLYGGNLRGVRIGIPHNCSPDSLFYAYETTQIVGNKFNIKDIGAPELFRVDIDYKKDEEREKTVSNFLFTSGRGDKAKTFLANSDFPKFKHPHWVFEEEKRFVIRAFGTDINVEKIEQVEEEIPPYFDLSLKENFFSQIKITYGPHCNEGEIILLDTLLKRYIPEFNSDAQLKKSKIEIKNIEN